MAIMSCDNEKPVAVVSGTSRGVGEVIARHLLAKGYIVHGCSRGDSPVAHADYKHRSIDLGVPENAIDWVRQIENEYSRIDVLVNNAAIADFGPALFTSINSVRQTMTINLVTPMALCREVGRIMIGRKVGRIINISSVATSLNAEGTSLYSSSKAALEKFTCIFAKELSDYGVYCNAVALSYMKSELAGKTSVKAKEELWKFLSVKREIQPADLTFVLEFLLSEENTIVNGHVLKLGF